MTATKKETTADDFLNEPDAKPVGESIGNKDFQVQILTAAERDYCYESGISTAERKVRLLEVGILDAAGENMFDYKQASAMMEKRSNTIEKLLSMVIKYNNATDEPEPVGNES